MAHPHDANRRHWDEVTALHRDSAFYDVEGFLAGRCTIGPIEREALAPLLRRNLLHLQCHFGLDTLSLLRLGAARVTGVDFSAPAIAEARRLADRLKLSSWADFIEADVLDLDLGRRFDRIFTSHGAINWLSDIGAWGRVVARHLAPDGVFYMMEAHPVGLALDVDGEGRLYQRFPYFHAAEPLNLDGVPDYAEPDYLPKEPGIGWAWTIADVMAALEDAGLQVFAFREYPFAAWEALPAMTPDAERHYWHRAKDAGPDTPLLFSLKARHPI
ncbi:class I SAM-dependent methyltransferase [Zavarzinia compransoris]|uniref:class I SAM-dependent methyltransferase n=1 Tax=Zavarzinia marina TaxID=2911065 RepID=UPI001F167411|nr:class I SAM-dependent methyltransferase [Zavarzinia marina]MCF4165389.1 class I SAM-dependent methyltransferase [Zavarzinia marina]